MSAEPIIESTDVSNSIQAQPQPESTSVEPTGAAIPESSTGLEDANRWSNFAETSAAGSNNKNEQKRLFCDRYNHYVVS